MLHHFKPILLTLAVAGVASSATAFSLLGPLTDWQVSRIGYTPPANADIGGPMNLGEEYRWNVPTITYGFDESFLNYFGSQGQQAIQQAIDILNALPPVSSMSSNLTEFSQDTSRLNYRALGLNLLDLKSAALATLTEEIGLASPERYTWTLRFRRDNPINYTVIRRNFDPVTLNPSSYVNGTLYTYVVQEFTQPDWADAVEQQVDPLQFGFTSVANGIDGWLGSLNLGQYYTGLTRDDVGGLRYIYKPSNYNVESLLPGTTGAGFGATSGGSPWVPWPGTGTGTNINGLVADTALRSGVNKLTFQQGRYDSILGGFITITNAYTDTFVTNGTQVSQSVQRVLTQPDILFSAEDLGVNEFGFPFSLSRSENWVNNDALNGQAALDGPGIIQPQVVITFTKIGFWYLNQQPFALSETRPAAVGFQWGSFDGSTNAPIIYPNGTSIEQMEQMVLGQ